MPISGLTRKPVAVFAAILIAAAILTVPAAVGPARFNDSFWIDWVWLDQFADALRHGAVYPRWLPLSHGGLGSPVFYYYPPVAFFVASPFALAGLSTYSAIIAAFFVGYVVSGVAMYLWLKDQAPLPLLGAIVFMIAPYHAFDFYLRGAVAEFFAIACLPFVMLGLRRMIEGRPGGFVVTALGYATLIGSHLPLAVLASVFLIAPYLLVSARGRTQILFRVGAALALGLALASIYLVPALLLDRYRDAAVLWKNPYLQPQNWSLWNGQFLSYGAEKAVLTIAAALAIPLAGCAVGGRRAWPLLGLAGVALAIGLIPWIWSLPILRSVQFPFRLLPVTEFALATAVAFAPRRRMRLALLLLPSIALTGYIVLGAPRADVVPLAQLQAQHPDVPENLPPGARPYSWPSRWALGIASSNPRPRVESDVTVAPVFYFPSWRVTCEGRPVPTFAAPQTQLLAYRGRNCSRELVWTSAEKLGAVISGLALLVLLLVCASGHKRWLRNASAARKGGGGEVIA